jgi:CRP/FNR family cyclic AMP-dependent transcriptional regulator
MAVKSSPTLMKRFIGRAGKARFFEALLSQDLVARDQRIAQALAGVATRQELPANHELVSQGGFDTDIYFILSGSVSITVNGRLVATRAAGDHVGEMAMLDTTATRSAAVRTIEPTVVAKVPEAKFSQIADANPDLWRRTARTLAFRLKERNKFQAPPRSEPVIFIGSSIEGLSIAKAIHCCLQRRPYVAKLWTEGVFECSQTTIEDIIRATKQTDFAVLVLTADDVTKSRGSRKPAPRDNVIFEMGLFMGALGRERTYIVAPNKLDLKIPTDLLGVTALRFHRRRGRTLARNLQPVTKRIRELIEKYGPM